MSATATSCFCSLCAGEASHLPLATGSPRSLMAATQNKCNRTLSNNKGRVILVALGTTLLVIAYAIFILDPLDMILRKMMTISDGSFAFNLWKKPPVSLFLEVYIFNVTNKDEFLSGKEKLRFQEIGPYVFREVLENTNITFNENNTVSYVPRRTPHLVPELSVGDPSEDYINVPNIALLGLASMLHNSSIFLNLGLRQLTNFLGSQPFLNMSVQEFMWGYEDPLIKFAHTLIPRTINFPKLGILDRTYDEGDNILTMNIGPNSGFHANSNGQSKLFTLDSFNGSPGLTHWGYGKNIVLDHENNSVPELLECNKVRGTIEGIIFPRNVQRNMTFRVYRKTFCRSLPIVFEKEGMTDSGLRAFWYNVPDNALAPPELNPENKCYCDVKKEACLPFGLGDMTPCYYNIPAAVSFPHFYKADPILLSKVDGLSPNADKHKSYLIVQPDMGIPLTIHSRVQTNIVVKKTKQPNLAQFNDITLPLFWIDLYFDQLPKYILNLMQLAVVYGPVLQTIIMVILGTAGTVMVLYVTLSTIFSSMSGRETKPSASPVIWQRKYSSENIVRLSQREHLITRNEFISR